MKTLKRMLPFVLSLALCLLLFVSCQPSKPEPQSGNDTTTTTEAATTTTETTTTTTEPAPIIAVNRDLLSEISMPFALAREKHGEVTALYGYNGPVAVLADGSGRYVFKDGFGAFECGYFKPQKDESGKWLIDPIPQPKPDAIIKAMTGMKTSVIFLGLTESVTGEQLAAMYGVEFNGTTPAEMQMDGHNLCSFIIEDLSVSIRTESDFIITPDSTVHWIAKNTTPALDASVVKLNPRMISDLGKTYAEIEAQYGKPLGAANTDEIAFLFQTPFSFCQYIFNLTDTGTEEIRQAPKDASEHYILAETLPRPADDRICIAIREIIHASDLFIYQPKEISPEQLAQDIGAELTYLSHNQNPVGYDKVLIRIDNYEILIMCTERNTISPSSTVEYIKLIEY